ncbi:MAG: flagellar filament capping protein FliD [Desulfobaccales bacterium]
MSDSIYFGVDPATWYTSGLLNATFGTNFSPPSGITNPIATDSSAQTYANVGEQFNALNGLYQQAYNMNTQADQLSTGNPASVFYQQAAASSNPNAAAINYFDTNNSAGEVPNSTFNFDVTQIAQAQTNMGGALDPNAAAAINTGANQFTLTAGTNTYDLAVTVNPGDTNQTALAAMAQAINDANSGVQASVVSGANGAIQLQLQGQTGSINAFSVSDVSGNAVSGSGAANTTQNATSASYTMNGASYTQDNNAVFLLNGHLQVDLTGPGQSTVTVGPDTQGVVNAANSLIDAMNGLTSYLSSNQYLKSDLTSKWSGLVGDAANSLSQYGVSLDANSQLSLDTTALANALQSNPTGVQEALGGINGLATNLAAFVSGITSSPGAALLQSPPSSGYGAAYLRSFTSAPSFRIGDSPFFRSV